MSDMMSSWHPLGGYGRYGASLLGCDTTFGSAFLLGERSVRQDCVLTEHPSMVEPQTLQRWVPGGMRLLHLLQNSPCMPVPMDRSDIKGGECTHS